MGWFVSGTRIGLVKWVQHFRRQLGLEELNASIVVPEN
jgi:hypothetical protein